MQVYDAERCEWGNELVRVVPFIYHEHLNGRDVTIETTRGMRSFYYFLPPNRVIEKHRHRYNLQGLKKTDIPLQNLYDNELNYERWTPPPFKKDFANKPIKMLSKGFSKRRGTIIVSNKHNKEWLWEGLNTIPLDVLDEMFRRLTPKWNVVYNRLKPQFIVGDDDTLQHEEFDDASILDKHPSVIDINKLYLDNAPMDIGEFQLRLFSQADRYINVQGGLGHFAAFFGGKQLFYLERNGHKHIEHHKLQTLQAWHTQLGGAQIEVATRADILEKLDFVMN